MTPEQSRRCVRIAELYWGLHVPQPKENRTMHTIQCDQTPNDFIKVEPSKYRTDLPPDALYLSIEESGKTASLLLGTAKRRQLAAILLEGLPEMEILTVQRPAGAELPDGWEVIS